MARLFATVAQRLHLPVAHDPLRRSFNQFRFASRLVEPSAHPFPGDTVIDLGCRLICAAVTYSQMRLRDRTILLVWIIACALTPSHSGETSSYGVFSAISRPAVIRTLLGTLSSLRSPRLPDGARVRPPMF